MRMGVSINCNAYQLAGVRGSALRKHPANGYSNGSEPVFGRQDHGSAHSVRLTDQKGAKRQIELKPTQFAILETQKDGTKKTVGSITYPLESAYRIDIFNGKGGLAGTVHSPSGLRYLALPGSCVKIQGVELQMLGDPIISDPRRPRFTPGFIRPQTATTQATILGAGLGTRIEPLAGDSGLCSKPALPLPGRQSVIQAIANLLAKHNFTDLIVNTYFRPAALKESLAHSDARSVKYFDEPEPSGTAGPLAAMLTNPKHMHLLDQTKPLLVMQGDAVTDSDLSTLMRAHMNNRALITIGCQEVDDKDVEKFGIVVTDKSGGDGHSGQITGFQEKPKLAQAKSRLGNTGFYILSPAVYPMIREIHREYVEKVQNPILRAGKKLSSDDVFDFAKHIFPAVLKRLEQNPSLGRFHAQKVGGYWSDIGNPTQYLETMHDIHDGKVNISLPEDVSKHRRDGAMFWEGPHKWSDAQKLADREGAKVSGNVIVARPLSEKD